MIGFDWCIYWLVYINQVVYDWFWLVYIWIGVHKPSVHKPSWFNYLTLFQWKLSNHEVFPLNITPLGFGCVHKNWSHQPVYEVVGLQIQSKRISVLMHALTASSFPKSLIARLVLDLLKSRNTTVADTFWSVHIKCCFHQKKIKSKRLTTSLNLLNGNAETVIGQARKTWQAKHHVYTKWPNNIKLRTDQSGIQRQTVYKLNQIKFGLEKQRAKNEEKKQTELKKTQKDDVMEKYRKSSINDEVKNHD